MLHDTTTLAGHDLNRAAALALEQRGDVPDYGADIAAIWQIIDRFDIDLFSTRTIMGMKATFHPRPYRPHFYVAAYGTTRAEAVLRAVVQHRFGDTVELP